MAGKYTVGQRVSIGIEQKLAENPRYASFLSHHGKTGTVTAVRDMAGKDAGEPQTYEVRLDMSGNVILTVPHDALVAAGR